MVPQFEKRILDGLDLGQYDYQSIMHYPAFAFSKDRQNLMTIQPLGNQAVGQRQGLSQGDINAVAMLYPE